MRGDSGNLFWAGVGIAVALAVGVIFLWALSAGPQAGPWAAAAIIVILAIVFLISRERRKSG
jgi:uncharacterized membrane protein